MKYILSLLMCLSLLSCDQNSKQLKYADVDTSSNEVLHLTDIEDNYFTLDDLIELNKGKVIFLHIWNSSAPISMELMPAVEKLEKEFEGKDLVVINIGTDAVMLPFENHLSITTLKNNYLARDFEKAVFFSDNEITRLPRYMIFDKKGNLIDNNAMSPDKEILVPTLENIIAQ